ncbi:gamma-parvin isoform X6 [Oxyura jamaicensis]|uniref:gamma-parvin isoform X6 n=1 Tax=Oxyura jamaicensis TaxID=8884 RepID=UPI0015A69E1A|nr:gamma-parvin isoform X6 [Oxyura jamaicensis]
MEDSKNQKLILKFTRSENTMDPDILNVFTQPPTLNQFLVENAITPGEKKKLIKPTASINPKLEELKLLLIDWINTTLKQEHIVVKSLEEDLYDGLVLHHLFAILTKDLLSTLHLLVAIVKHFQPSLAIPPNVRVETITIENTSKGLKTTSAVEYITGSKENLEEQSTGDAFDELFSRAPDRLDGVKKVFLQFVNQHVGKLGLNVKDMESQFADGVILLLLIGQLEGYFLNLKDFFLTPASTAEMLHNVNLALDLLTDGGLLNFSVNSEDIVKGDMKSTMQILYCLYSKYKTKET